MIATGPSRRALMVTGLTAAASLGVFGVWALRRFDPNTTGSPLLPCLFHHFTGLYCPGCGTTRALHAVVHGDLAGAVAMNPLLAVLAVLLPLVALHGSGHRVRLPKPVMDTLLGGKFWLLLIGGFWLLRNLPWWPFAWMAPG